MDGCVNTEVVRKGQPTEMTTDSEVWKKRHAPTPNELFMGAGA